MKISNPVYQQKISDIYAEYKKTVSPLVAFLEANDAEYPVEILNEIRAIFTHFSRAYDESASEEEISSEIKKAEGHLKRAILDCYKYNCVSLYDFIISLEKSINLQIYLALIMAIF